MIAPGKSIEAFDPALAAAMAAERRRQELEEQAEAERRARAAALDEAHRRRTAVGVTSPYLDAFRARHER